MKGSSPLHKELARPQPGAALSPPPGAGVGSAFLSGPEEGSAPRGPLPFFGVSMLCPGRAEGGQLPGLPDPGKAGTLGGQLLFHDTTALGAQVATPSFSVLFPESWTALRLVLTIPRRLTQPTRASPRPSPSLPARTLLLPPSILGAPAAAERLLQMSPGPGVLRPGLRQPCSISHWQSGDVICTGSVRPAQLWGISEAGESLAAWALEGLCRQERGCTCSSFSRLQGEEAEGPQTP